MYSVFFIKSLICFLSQSFTLDAAKMTFPPDSVCLEGTEPIQRFLCSGEVLTDRCTQ